jgi:plastocyanin
LLKKEIKQFRITSVILATAAAGPTKSRSGGFMRSASLRLAIVAVSALCLYESSPLLAKIWTVSVINNSFTPKKTRVSYGDTVRWIRAAGTVSHTTTSDALSPKSWNSSTLAIGVPFDVEFKETDGPGPFPYHCAFHATMKDTIFVQSLDVEVNEVDGLPRAFSLEQNFPNPFNPTTTIHFSLEQSEEVTFRIFNIAGQLVEEQNLGRLTRGSYSITWSANGPAGSLPSGVYFYRLRAGEQTLTRKMLLLK